MNGQRVRDDKRIRAAGARVLICGAGFAGLATAFWMERLGYEVTIVEVAAGLRRGGTPVDIKEGTVDVVRRMGLLDAVRAASLPPRRTEFRTADDVAQAVMPARPSEIDGPDESHEIHRDTLLEILAAAVESKVEIIFGRSVVRFDDGAEGVAAHFDDGSSHDYALAFGCDGLRSATRRLVFGDGHMRFMESYAFLKVVAKTFIEPDSTQIHSVPGRTVMLNGYDGKTDIALGFHAERELSFDHRDGAAVRRLVVERFAGLGWRVPELLEEVGGDFYFDGIYQIRMPAWSKGRVALVGDAGYCPSPFAGMGGSMALVGAAALADAFARHGGDHAAAFQAYEAGLRPFVERVQDDAETFGRTMFGPATEAAIAERDLILAEMGRDAVVERA